MDRKTALDILEVARPNSADTEDPRLAAALDALSSDEVGRQALERMQELDRQLADAVQDVPVPEGLEQRLLASLAAAHSSIPNENVPPNRRRVLWRALAAAAVLLFAAGWWFWPSAANQVALVEFETAAPFAADKLSTLTAFAGDPHQLPDGGWLDPQRVLFTRTVKTFPYGTATAHVYEFHFTDPRAAHRGPVRGVLYVLPRESVAAAPVSLTFHDGMYAVNQSKPQVAIRSWTERDLVYVCMVRIEDFDSLAQALDVAPA